MLKRHTTREASIKEDIRLGRMSGRANPKEWGLTPKPGYMYTAARAISSRVNANYDAWTPEELQENYQSFLHKPVYVEHQNWDPSKTRGVIVGCRIHNDRLASGHPDTWVELLMEVDAQSYPRLAKAIREGELNTTSMGTDIEYSICSICGNLAEDTDSYCEHIARKGQMIKAFGSTEPKLSFETCYGSAFFEISYVFDPADESAYLLDVYETPSVMARKASMVEIRLPSKVDTLEEEESIDDDILDDIEEEFGADPETSPQGQDEERLQQIVDEFGTTGGEPIGMDEYQDLPRNPNVETSLEMQEELEGSPRRPLAPKRPDEDQNPGDF